MRPAAYQPQPPLWRYCHTIMFDIALKIARARTAATLLTAGIVALTVLLFAFLSGIMALQKTSMLQIARLGSDSLTLMEKGRGALDHNDQALGLRSSLPEILFRREVIPLSHPLITEDHSGPVLVSQVDDLGYGKPKIILWGLPAQPNGTIHPEDYVGQSFSRRYSGQALHAHQAGFLIGQAAAEHYQLSAKAVGTLCSLPTAVGTIRARCLGIITDHFEESVGHNDPMSHALFMPLQLAQQTLHRSGEISYIRLQASRPEAFLELSARLTQLPTVQAWTCADLNRAVDQSLGSMITIMAALKYFILSIALATMFNVFFLTVTNRQHLWSTMKACGAPHSLIFSLIASESLLISTLGALLGTLVAGLLLTAIVGSLKLAALLFGPVLLGALMLGILVGPLGSLLPALKAARVAPAQGLRHG